MNNLLGYIIIAMIWNGLNLILFSMQFANVLMVLKYVQIFVHVIRKLSLQKEHVVLKNWSSDIEVLK